MWGGSSQGDVGRIDSGAERPQLLIILGMGVTKTQTPKTLPCEQSLLLLRLPDFSRKIEGDSVRRVRKLRPLRSNSEKLTRFKIPADTLTVIEP